MKSSGQTIGDAQSDVAALGDDGDLPRLGTHFTSVAIIAELREWHRQREDLYRPELSLNLQLKAIARRLKATRELVLPFGVLSPEKNSSVHCDHDTQVRVDAAVLFASFPLLACKEELRKQRRYAEREMIKLAKQLPAFGFVQDTYGFGEIGFAQIVGEAGDLSNYSNPAKLWKRMGLASINGAAQGWVIHANGERRRVMGEDAKAHGYVRRRRALMAQIGDGIIKCQGRKDFEGDRFYYKLYCSRKEFEQQKDPEARPIVHHLRARRYMEKRLLRDLWRAWRTTFKTM